jgi:hypothetical protein
MLFQRNIFKNVVLNYTILYLALAVTPTASSTISGFLGATSFSYNSSPLNRIRKTRTSRTISAVLMGQRERNAQLGLAMREGQSLSMVLGGPPLEGYDDINSNLSEDNNLKSILSASSEFETALAIVPPLEDWDRLQRARHYARDPVFREWPPAIRLFHPFDRSTNVAFDVAQLIEDLELEAFEITLDSWVIVPNVEATQMEWKNQQVLPDVVEGVSLGSYYEKLNHESDKEVQELIKAEERKGKIKALKKNSNGMTAQRREEKENSHGTMARGKKSPAEIRDEQRKSIEDDFGGPCVLCLEPNEESIEKLTELRELLREGLGLQSYSSPSSLYSWELVEYIDTGYRPLIPISKFDSFRTAMEIARRLKGLWEDPLTINVKCLEILSCNCANDIGSTFDDKDGAESESTHFPNHKRFAHQVSQVEMKQESYGCNARIMLLGEEIQQDDKANEKMIDQLLEAGEIGGGDISMDFTILDDEEETVTDLEKWLDEDDDFDEGTQVTIGRTHFFTGDQRNYKGMPATSAVDAKDRSLGEAGSVSGLARRRGSTSRKQNVWEDGEYGRRNKDFLPWGLRERKGKEKFTWNEDEQ